MEAQAHSVCVRLLHEAMEPVPPLPLQLSVVQDLATKPVISSYAQETQEPNPVVTKDTATLNSKNNQT